MTSDFKFSAAVCDVEDTETLEAYREKRLEWLNWLEGDESHAIVSLIHNMAWNDVSFRFLAHMAEQDPSSPLHNSLLAEVVIDGHFATQVLAIRRLMDERKDVISLRRLLADLKEHQHLLTRENYVAHDGLPYDHDEAERRVWKHREGSGPFWGATSGPEAYSTSKRAHEFFDKLTGVAPEDRTRSERIPFTLFDRLSEWLNGSGADQLVLWSHKFLAHSADATSRQRVDLVAAQPNLAKITNAIRSFARVSQAISQQVLFNGGFGNLVPVAQFDKYEFLRLASDADPEALELYWDQLADERDAFLDGIPEALISPTVA